VGELVIGLVLAEELLRSRIDRGPEVGRARAENSVDVGSELVL
jgi:hypothetical protein